jgi:hypothetical protein
MSKILKFRFLGIAAFLAVIAVFSAAVMLLWNVLMPDIFGLPVINYWQSLGLSVLARILFGGLDFMGGGRFVPHTGQSRDERNFHHGNALREKWMKMSEEERNEFMRRHHGFGRFHDFFDEGRRGRCGGGAPAEGGSGRPPQAGCSEGGDFPPHDKKGDGNE